MKTIRITVETETLMIVHPAKTTSAWCPGCGAEVDVITLGDRSFAEPAMAVQIQQWLGPGQLHLWHPPSGPAQICVSSLMQCLHFEEVRKIAVFKKGTLFP